MSHVTTVTLKITNLDALEKACKRIGCTLKRGQKTFKWYGKWVNDYNKEDAAYHHGIKPEDYGKCDHAISVDGKPSAYEVGLVQQGDHYAVVFDFYAGGHGLISKIGDDASQLMQNYSREVVLEQAAYMGCSVTEEMHQGELVMELVRY